jgi:acetoin utilization deacetylase AcuC-like enzyme
VAVVYDRRYASALAGLPVDPLRAERTLAFLLSEGLILRRDVHRPRPASLKSLRRTHSAPYLESVHKTKVLGRIFGADITRDQVDRLLDHQRLTTGGTKLATRLALGHRLHGRAIHMGRALHGGRALAINLAGGQHHAHRESGAGFCIFNDVAVAISHARAHGFAGKVLIVDLDLHDGDGTRAIFAQDRDVHTFSLHAHHWGSTEAVASTAIALGDNVTDKTYLETLESSLPAVLEAAAPDLVYYLAGTDPAFDDRMGDWRISAAGMLARDRLVLDLVHGRLDRGSRRRRGARRRTPLVVTLAGGYGPHSWRYTARFLSYAIHGAPIEPPATGVMTLKRFRYLARLQDPAELSGSQDNAFGLSEADVLPPRWGPVRETRLLGFYTKHGLELVLERSGLLDRLRDLGFSHPTLELALDDPAGHGVRVWGSPAREELLVEVRLGRDRRTVPGLTLLSIEWLQLQNPRMAFRPGQRPLPGQAYPGLGMAHETVALCAVACERLHLDGVVWSPAHFHTAGPWQQVAIAIDPVAAAELRALAKLFADTPLEEASQAVASGAVINRTTGKPLTWRPVPMVLPLSPAAHEWAEARRAAIEAEPLPNLTIRPRPAHP